MKPEKMKKQPLEFVEVEHYFLAVNDLNTSYKLTEKNMKIQALQNLKITKK